MARLYFNRPTSKFHYHNIHVYEGFNPKLRLKLI